MYKSLKELRKTNGESTNNIFKSFGLDYIYENDRNNTEKMIELFKKVKDIDHPTIVHINTVKGKGYKLAEEYKEEYLAMLDWSIEQDEYPVMILMSGNGVISDNRMPDKTYNNKSKFKVEEKGEKVAIIALGDFYQKSEELSRQAKEKLGFTPTLINPRYISGIDTKLLEKLKENHSLVIILEDGIKFGGFGSNIASYYGDSDIKIKVYGLEKEFYDRYNADELLQSLGITAK